MRAEEVHVFITGFTESLSGVTGLEKIWQQVRGRSSETVWVLPPLVWDSDWEVWAAFLARNLAEDPKVYIYAYSWGAGYGFVKLAERLGERHNIDVEAAALADPVYRSPRLAMRWRSLVNRGPLAPVITVPPNVAEVRWVRQRENKPQAHEIFSSQFTEVRKPVTLRYVHGNIDNSDEYAKMCLRLGSGPLRAAAGA